MGVLVGRPAPDFTAAAVTGSGEIVENYNLGRKHQRQESSYLLLPFGFHLCLPVRIDRL